MHFFFVSAAGAVTTAIGVRPERWRTSALENRKWLSRLQCNGADVAAAAGGAAGIPASTDLITCGCGLTLIADADLSGTGRATSCMHSEGDLRSMPAGATCMSRPRVALKASPDSMNVRNLGGETPARISAPLRALGGETDDELGTWLPAAQEGKATPLSPGVDMPLTCALRDTLKLRSPPPFAGPVAQTSGPSCAGGLRTVVSSCCAAGTRRGLRLRQVGRNGAVWAGSGAWEVVDVAFCATATGTRLGMRWRGTALAEAFPAEAQPIPKRIGPRPMIGLEACRIGLEACRCLPSGAVTAAGDAAGARGETMLPTGSRLSNPLIDRADCDGFVDAGCSGSATCCRMHMVPTPGFVSKSQPRPSAHLRNVTPLSPLRSSLTTKV